MTTGSGKYERLLERCAGLEPVPEVVDIRLVYREHVLCAGGDHRHGIRLDPRDLLRLAEPRVADICEHDGDHRFADLPKI